MRSLRLPLNWASVEEQSPYLVAPDWSGFDHSVGLAAKYGMRVFPFVWGTPPWVAGQQRIEPVAQRLGSAAPGPPSCAGRCAATAPTASSGAKTRSCSRNRSAAWEIWNEENIITFSADPSPAASRRMMRVAGRAIHGADRGAKVILGGLFGRPLQVPPNVASGDFLNRFYRAGHVKRFFDGVALHPYVADASAMRPQISNLRRIMRRHHDAATPLYVTELGWGSDSFQTRWERGLYGQARELDQAFSMLANHRRYWRVAGVWWFTWADTVRLCQFCDSAGLLTEAAKPSPPGTASPPGPAATPRSSPGLASEQVDRADAAHRVLVVGQVAAPAVVRLGGDEVGLRVGFHRRDLRRQLVAGEAEGGDDPVEFPAVLVGAPAGEHVVDRVDRAAAALARPARGRLATTSPTCSSGTCSSTEIEKTAAKSSPSRLLGGNSSRTKRTSG